MNLFAFHSRFIAWIRSVRLLLSHDTGLSLWRILTMPSAKVQAALNILSNELPPLVAAKADAAAGVATAQANAQTAAGMLAAAQDNLDQAEQAYQAAQGTFSNADAVYDAKLEEVKQLLAQAQAE